jgi:hypothetical protein
MFGGRRGDPIHNRIASALEITIAAREKGLPVVVGDEEPQSKSAFQKFGATSISRDQDPREHYKLIAEALGIDTPD